ARRAAPGTARPPRTRPPPPTPRPAWRPAGSSDTGCSHLLHARTPVWLLGPPGLSHHRIKLRVMTQQLPAPCQRLLRQQRGVIAGWKPDPAGLSSYRVESLVRAGHWQRLHYGVYATFTGEPPRAAVLWAAVLRTGRRSILSHE